MIRHAVTEDIAALMALQRALEMEGALSGYKGDSAEDWFKRDFQWSYVAVLDDRLTGFIYCQPRAHGGECVFPTDAKILEIVELIVGEDSRRQQCGSDLLAAAQKQAREAGFTHLRVYSAAKRFNEVVNFYRKSGFSPWYLEMTREL